MDKNEQYFKANRDLWDAKTNVHVKSRFYDVESFKQTGNSLSKIELNDLGDVSGKKILHLQCHFGQDSISLQKLGADVTAVDFSPNAIAAGRSLAHEMGSDVRFVESNVYDVPNNINGEFDLAYSTFGTICWLPDLDKWAEVIKQKLKSGGQLYLAEFHPFVDCLDDEYRQFGYPYFNDRVLEGTFEGTYADRSADIQLKEYFWNHPISEVLNALIKAGFTLEFFNEFNYTPWPCFPNLKKRAEREWVFEHLDSSIPMVYSLMASTKG